ncbi:MAG: hypothetical protein KF729_04585 [Sandaracinaceae bacterium]|nr:hypothetical protein [Sandaracinaceae bacterium]
MIARSDSAPRAATASFEAHGQKSSERRSVQIDMGSEDAAAGLCAGLAVLFLARATSVRATTDDGGAREDLSAGELGRRMRTRDVDSVELVVPLGAAAARIELRATRAGAVVLDAPVTSAPSTATAWLECDADFLTRPPTLALPVADGALSREGLHALVAFAAAHEGFVGASFDGARWWRAAPADPPRALAPVRGTREEAPLAWYAGPDAPEERAVDAAWWAALASLLEQADPPLAPLHAHLNVVFRIPFPWELAPRSAVLEADFRTPPHADAVAQLVPVGDRVIVAVDFALGARLAELLAHLLAHLELGHVRPGDPHAHWDTLASATAPSRRWDREAQAWCARVCPRPHARRVTSLAECTPLEKGWLVLYGHIARMVGETRTLHPATEAYPVAAYQRQAAQRLVAQLEEYGGAMLCDGVGLGKTYVATAVVVHYANAWRERLDARGRTAPEDPFRVTILAPGSVVSTWAREALPPLAAHGVSLASIRVVSHTKLSRVVPASDVLAAQGGGASDMEHLLLSDLVVVDEAHNFRSVGARRTTVLRDLLRLQPRRDARRKVLLLTATPINNSLEDLRQQAALMFGKALWLDDELTPDRYRARAVRVVEDRIAKAGKSKQRGADVAALLVHGSADARFAYAPEFRDDLQFGVQVPRVGDYLKEQEKRLAAQRDAVRDAIQRGQAPPATPARIAGELLDRVVVQRSRALCRQIEREQGSTAPLLFRPDAGPPEKLVYEDVYDDTRDVLARFLPLFESAPQDAPADLAPLSLAVYTWSDVRDGVREAGEVSSVVGLQRVLVLKRLESSPVAFLITLLRLLALHAHRLQQLLELCGAVQDRERAAALDAELAALVADVPEIERARLDLLLTGAQTMARGGALLARWSHAHLSARPAADTDDPLPPQLGLFDPEDEAAMTRREQLDRLWGLREALTRDLATLLRTAPGLAGIVFGRFAPEDWPRRFIHGGQGVDWPKSAPWAMRIVTDGKLRRLVARLLAARAAGQKAIVFSQFTDTLAYLDSVLRAAPALERSEWKTVLRELSAGAGHLVSKHEVLDLIGRVAVVSGATEERDAVIHAFAPFYRLGPARPPAVADAAGTLRADWERGWAEAMRRPIDVLFATDVLAEGVNLQDVALLLNYDVHWNPVRMIQRAGRIDRRLSPAIEEATRFPDIEALARELGVDPPRYWWHAHPGAAPVTVNLLLPDELEAELQLRERIALKTLAIDFTLGLEQGTGAEADWMAEYRYQGISALNAWQGDRAIEQIAGYQQRLRRLMSERGIDAEWLAAWNGWLREVGGRQDDRILAWAQLGRKGGETTVYTRQLQPRLVDGVPHWLWTTAKPADSLLNFWLALDSKTFPAATRTGLPFSEDASRPIAAEDLLAASRRLVDEDTALEELGDMRRPLLQGASAISAGFLGAEPDRRAIAVSGFRLLQLRVLDEAAPVRPSEEA